MRFAEHSSAWEVPHLVSIEEAAGLLKAEDDIVLALPVDLVLAQRFRLPTTDPSEFTDMVRIQIEKAMPYSTEEMTTDSEVISQTEEGSVISAVAVHNEKLGELAAPLISRGLIPSQVTVYAGHRAATHLPEGTALFIYPENEALVCAISEEGKLSFTRTLDGADALQLQRDLPQLALSAELQGINASNPRIWRRTSTNSAIPWKKIAAQVGIDCGGGAAGGLPPESSSGELAAAPRAARPAQWKKRLLVAACAYARLVLLFLAYFLILKVQVGRLDSRIAKDAPRADS